MYKNVKDDDNKMFLVNLDEDIKKAKKVYTGFYESHLLCSDCDNLNLGKLDAYGDSILYKDFRKSKIVVEQKISNDGLRSLSMKSVDYRKLKLFILSVLWRGHISNHKFFKNIDIGEDEHKIRNMIIENSPGSDEEFKIVIMALKNKSGNLIRTVVDPFSIKGNVAYFFINGFLYIINLNKNNSFSEYKDIYLKETGELDIPIVEAEIAQRILKSLGLPDYFIEGMINIK